MLVFLLMFFYLLFDIVNTSLYLLLLYYYKYVFKSIHFCSFLHTFYYIFVLAFECPKNAHFSDVFRALQDHGYKCSAGGFRPFLDVLRGLRTTPARPGAYLDQHEGISTKGSARRDQRQRGRVSALDHPGSVHLGEGETGPGPRAGVNREMREKSKKKYKHVLT